MLKHYIPVKPARLKQVLSKLDTPAKILFASGAVSLAVSVIHNQLLSAQARETSAVETRISTCMALAQFHYSEWGRQTGGKRGPMIPEKNFTLVDNNAEPLRGFNDLVAVSTPQERHQKSADMGRALTLCLARSSFFSPLTECVAFATKKGPLQVIDEANEKTALQNPPC